MGSKDKGVTSFKKEPHHFFPQKHKNKELTLENDMAGNHYTLKFMFKLHF